MNNPYELQRRTGSTHIDRRTGAPVVEEFRRESGAQRMFSDSRNSNGDREINASSRRELLAQIGQLHTAIAQGQITRGGTPAEIRARFAEFKSAYEDSSPEGKETFRVIGEVMGDEIWETLGREGFSRKLLFTQEVTRGVVGQVKVRQKDVLAWQATSATTITASEIRQKYMYPSEFYLTCRILIENKELDQASNDLLDEKYQDGLEQILRREDLITKSLLDAAAPVFNPLSLFTNFTPQVLSSMRTNVARWGIPASTCLIAWDLWNDIIADPDFVNWFDQVTKHELVLEGRLGSIMGMEILTDGFRYETLQVLNPGEIYVVGPPTTLGAITQRSELQSAAVDLYSQGIPARGWFLQQIQGQVVGNGRSVAKGSRI